jgi:hypothetical protein
MRAARTTVPLILTVALVMPAATGADDRDFLRERSAPPNILFILDTSSSMVGTPETTTPGAIDGAQKAYGMLPGGGDDPSSRMGIAKIVLRDFLATVTDANFALAGYAQQIPQDGSGNDLNAVPTKHWTYEAEEADRFRMIEPQYAYRLGYQETWDGQLLPNPADYARDFLIGYSPYFSPDSSSGAYVAMPNRSADSAW